MEGRKPVALWAAPRSISTAFERIFVEREDFEVYHEPFAASYYFSEQRRSDRYPEKEPNKEHLPENVLAEICSDNGDKGRSTFFKDMAYHTVGFRDKNFVDNFHNTFLIRDPKQTLASFYKMWPDFTFEEAGHEQLYRLFECVVEAGQEPIVIEATEFAANTESMMAAYCKELGIPSDSDALSWEEREVPEWQLWEEWHTGAQDSTGIEELPQKEVALPQELRETYERCLPYYERLYENRLVPSDSDAREG